MNNIHPKLKKIIFDYLLKELVQVEIIYYCNSIWFINRENRYWYFEYQTDDNHLWWRWSHFNQSFKIFSMDAENEQHLFGELVNMILTKKQKIESKYPNKIFQTVGSVLKYQGEVDEVLNCEVNTTHNGGSWHSFLMDEVLNCEVNTTTDSATVTTTTVDEVLNCEVNTTYQCDADAVERVDEVLNCEVNTTQSAFFGDTNNVIEDVLNFDVKTTDHNQPFTNELIDKVLKIETINYNTETSSGVVGTQKGQVDKVLDNSVEIKTIQKLNGENPFQDIVVSHILDESDKVTDKLKIIQDNSVMSHGHDVYISDFLVQNVLDIGVNSIHYDTHNHQPIVDGILKKV